MLIKEKKMYLWHKVIELHEKKSCTNMDLVHFSVINPIQEIVLGTRVNHGKTRDELFIFTFCVCMLVCNNKYIQQRVGA